MFYMETNFFRQIVFFLLLIFFISSINYGCTNEASFGKLFSYPPDSTPHEDNWTYFGSVTIIQKEKGSFAKKAHKTIYINIIDRNENNFLSDELEYYSAGIDIRIEWNEFENLNISLFEEGNEFAEDDYNKYLIEKGPIKLIHLMYTFNPSVKKFVRSNESG